MNKTDTLGGWKRMGKIGEGICFLRSSRTFFQAAYKTEKFSHKIVLSFWLKILLSENNIEHNEVYPKCNKNVDFFF